MQHEHIHGDWTIKDNGTLDVDSTGFDTKGALTWKGGTIDVADGCVANWHPEVTG